MKIIFLDFDGPLNTGRYMNRCQQEHLPTEDRYGTLFDPMCVAQLQRIVEETDAKIVVTSSWTNNLNYKGIVELWEDRCLPGVVIDVIPNSSSRLRGLEIDSWLRSCPDECECVIISDLDMSNFWVEQHPYLIQVDPDTGITKKLADRAITILGKTESMSPSCSSPMKDLKMIMDARLLIIPDIHGRTFWKQAVEAYPDIPVVFLGDYLDPYEWEQISPQEALNNMLEIFEYKKANPDRVTLLLGNHDVAYFDKELYCSRKNFENEDDICYLLNNNMWLFALAYSIQMAGKEFLLTHAGVLRTWFDQHFAEYSKLLVEGVFPADSIRDTLNAQCTTPERLCEFLKTGLWEVPLFRGGLDASGSVVWADSVEHTLEKNQLPAIVQIFGHTQQFAGPIIKEGYACLDCRCAFVLTAKGEIK